MRRDRATSPAGLEGPPALRYPWGAIVYEKRLLPVLCFRTVLLVLILCLPGQGTAHTWGYPPDSSLGQCLASRPCDCVVFPDRDTALAAVEAEKAAAQAYCAALPNPKPGWCSAIRSYEWTCTYVNMPEYCLTTCGCSMIGCTGLVTDCGFTCYNCRDYGTWVNGYWKPIWYWYPVCSSAEPSPAQQPDSPTTTEVTDKNSGGPCEGACNTTVNDISKNNNPGFEIP